MLKWFAFNEMKSNNDKCHLLVTNCIDAYATVGNENITANDSVKLLGVTIDNKLNFNEHVTKLCKKANHKYLALVRVSNHMSQEKMRLIMKSFIEAQFNYCPLIWMFHSRTLNNKINRLHERALRLVYKNSINTFQELLDKDNSFTIHDRNLQKLAVEMYKVKHNLSSKLMSELFPLNTSSYNLRNKRFWENSNVRTVHYGTETISFRGPKTWDLVPQVIRLSKSLIEFKYKIKTWKPNGCACRLCKAFIPELGFL